MDDSVKSHLISFIRTFLSTAVTLFGTWLLTLQLTTIQDFKMAIIVLVLSCVSWGIWAGLKTLWMTSPLTK